MMVINITHLIDKMHSNSLHKQYKIIYVALLADLIFIRLL